MIPVASRLWTPAERLPLDRVHPAARLGGGVLAVATSLLAPPLALMPLAALVAWFLLRAGLRAGGLLRWLRPWWPVAMLVLVIHTLTTTDAAPLFHPSAVGLLRGLLALARLALMLGAMALITRVLPLPDLVAALGWWLRPLRCFGADTRHLGLTLAVALGTAPRAQAEARRILACVRLRRGDGRRRRGLQLRQRLQVIPPLMEGIIRQGESLPLAVAGRLPAQPERPARLPWPQGVVLVAWAALLVVGA